MVTDTTEKGLEALITNSLTNNGWLPGDLQDYERAHCVDLSHLSAFLSATQPETSAALALNLDSTTRRRFLDRLKREITSRGIIDVLRKGIQHGPSEINLFYGTPTPGNTQAEERYRQNRFSVTRQLRYSASNQQLSLDIALFVNGLPIATMELKNRFTGQTVVNAVEQYKRPEVRRRTSSGWAGAPSTSPSTMKRSSSAQNSRERRPTSCPSTRARRTAAPATRSTRAG